MLILENRLPLIGSSNQEQMGASSFVDSVLQTLASLLVNKTGMEQRLEIHLASRVNKNYFLMFFVWT